MSKETIDWLQKHLYADHTSIVQQIYKPYSRQIKCFDGATLSVQARKRHYFTPIEDVEVGYPSITPPDSWMEYAQNVDAPTDTVYLYIPIGLVAEFIDAHGGVNFKQTDITEAG